MSVDNEPFELPLSVDLSAGRCRRAKPDVPQTGMPVARPEMFIPDTDPCSFEQVIILQQVIFCHELMLLFFQDS